MLATVLYRLAETPHVATTTAFQDVDTRAYYADAVAWGRINGIINGTSENLFSPDKKVTREQIVVFLYRYASYCGCDVSSRTSLEQYADFREVSGYAQDALAWAVSIGLINGRTEDMLAPQGTATRAETAVLLMRFTNLFQ